VSSFLSDARHRQPFVSQASDMDSEQIHDEIRVRREQRGTERLEYIKRVSRIDQG